MSATARALSVLDIANGVSSRRSPDEVAFPILDTTVHLITAPVGEWIGFDTAVTFGGGGIGLTHAVLHDSRGAVGTMAQILTVRPQDQDERRSDAERPVLGV